MEELGLDGIFQDRKLLVSARAREADPVHRVTPSSVLTAGLPGASREM